MNLNTDKLNKIFHEILNIITSLQDIDKDCKKRKCKHSKDKISNMLLICQKHILKLRTDLLEAIEPDEGIKMNLKGILSTIGLVGLITFDAILIAICGFSHQWWWMWFFISITALVGIFETTSYILTGKTISQHWWVWCKTDKKAAMWSLAAAGAFLIAMNMLVLHLVSPLLALVFGG